MYKKVYKNISSLFDSKSKRNDEIENFAAEYVLNRIVISLYYNIYISDVGLNMKNNKNISAKHRA